MKHSKLPLDNQLLNFLFILSLLSIIFILLFSKYIPLHFNWGQKFEDIILNLSLAIISSYAFYVIVVHRKIRKDSENINIFLSKLVKNLLEHYIMYLNVLDSTKDVISEMTIDEVKKLCSSVILKENSEMILNRHTSERMTNKMFLYYTYSTQKQLAQDIYVLMPFLDSNFIRILSQITTCEQYSKIELFNPRAENMTNLDLSGFATSIFDLNEAFVALDKYFQEQLKSFSDKPSNP